VRFTLTPVVIDEPPELCDLLQEMRINNYYQKKLDHFRMEQMLTPIFCSLHREKIYKKLIKHNL
jgi:hypothetical protein